MYTSLGFGVQGFRAQPWTGENDVLPAAEASGCSRMRGGNEDSELVQDTN